MVCDFVIGRFRSVWCVSVFQGLLLVIIMIDSSKNAFVKAAFELQSLHGFEKSSNIWHVTVLIVPIIS